MPLKKVPVCCRCNREGTCRNCSCAKSKSCCNGCLLSRLGRCQNEGTSTQLVFSSPLSSSSQHSSRLLEPPSSLMVQPPCANQLVSSPPALLPPSLEPVPSLPLAPSLQSTPSESIEPLPPHQPLQQPLFKWNDIDGPIFIQAINSCYSEVVHWRHNLFKVPAGQAGKAFVKELSRMLLLYGEGTAMECIAMKAAFTLPALVLQKPHPRSKTTEHGKCLLRRLELWKQGDISTPLAEGKVIQRHLSRSPQRHNTTEDKARQFGNLVKKGKLKAAQRLLQQDDSGMPLCLTQEVKESLQRKHPPRQPPSPEAVKLQSLATEAEENSHLCIYL